MSIIPTISLFLDKKRKSTVGMELNLIMVRILGRFILSSFSLVSSM